MASSTQIGSRHKIFAFACFFCLLYLYREYKQVENSSPFQSSSNKRTSKWIVLLATKAPSRFIEELSAHSEWTMLVVESSPGVLRQWHLADVHFIPFAEQKKLGYSIQGSKDSNNHVMLRNIGFLYAIEKGAEWIYDIDEDYEPYGKALEQFDFARQVTGMRYDSIDELQETTTSHHTFNAFAFFGVEKRWPFGFPTDVIHNHTNDERFFRLCRKNQKPIIQHAMTVGADSSSASSGLLHDKLSNHIPPNFNRFTPPIIVAPGTYAPFGTNTLFHYSSFAALFLPPSASSRMAHARRAVFAHKMLQLIDESLSILPPNSMKSFSTAEEDTAEGITTSERELYERLDDALLLARKVKCNGTELTPCLTHLSHVLEHHKFFGDTRTLELWLQDLKTIGYKMPPVREKSQLYALGPKDAGIQEMVNCRRSYMHFPSNLPVPGSDEPALERARMKIRDMEELSEWCATTDSVYQLNYTMPSEQEIADKHHQNRVLKDKLDTVLVLTHNYRWTNEMGLMQRLYEAYFGVIVFCGPFDEEKTDRESDANYPPSRKNVNYIRMTEKEFQRGYMGYICIAKAAELRLPNVKGYYIASDDMIFNVWQPTDMNRLNTATEHFNAILNWHNEKGPAQIRKVRHLVNVKYRNDEEVQQMEKTFTLSQNRYEDKVQHRFSGKSFDDMIINPDGWAHSDWLYIPQSNISFARIALQVFWEAQFFHELAISKLSLVLPSKFQDCRVNYIWFHRRSWWWELYREDYIGVHPIKMNEVVQDTTTKARFCSLVVDAFHRNLFTDHQAKTEVDCAGYEYWFWVDMAYRISNSTMDRSIAMKIHEEEEKRRAQDLKHTLDLEKEWGIKRKRF